MRVERKVERWREKGRKEERGRGCLKRSGNMRRGR